MRPVSQDEFIRELRRRRTGGCEAHDMRERPPAASVLLLVLVLAFTANPVTAQVLEGLQIISPAEPFPPNQTVAGIESIRSQLEGGLGPELTGRVRRALRVVERMETDAARFGADARTFRSSGDSLINTARRIDSEWASHGGACHRELEETAYRQCLASHASIESEQRSVERQWAGLLT